MEMLTGYALAALLLLGAALASAQSVVWTNEKLEYTTTCGYHLKAGPNGEGGHLADLPLAPATDGRATAARTLLI